MQSTENTRICFGEFELDRLHRSLLKGGRSVELKAKAFDLLSVLIENRGEVVSKNELLDRVWENQFVEENNLTVHMAALRKALGETKRDNRYIVTVPRSGYKFVAAIQDPKTVEITVETHRVERREIVRELEIQTRQSELAANEQDRTAAALLPWSGFYHGIRKYLIAAGLVIMVGLAVGGVLLGPRLSGLFASVPLTKQSVTQNSFTSAGVPHRVAIAPDGRTIAYIQRSKGADSIWIGDLSTGTSIQIAEAADRLHEFLTFAPDGRSLYFTARDDNHLIWTLMNISIYGGPPRDLIEAVHSSVSFSPDGKSLTFLRKDANTGRKSLFIADAETGKDERLLRTAENQGEVIGHGVAWSPDGKLIAFALSEKSGHSCDIVTVDIITGAETRIGDKVCGRASSNLVWMRDGTGLVINRDDDNGGQIWLVSYPSGSVQRVTDDTLDYFSYSLSVSDDNQIAVLQARSEPKIWMAGENDLVNASQILDGSRLRSEGMHGLSFAPDGTILYTVRAGDISTIWQMNADGSKQRQLTASQKNSRDMQINVTADNRFLVFESNRSGESEIWRAGRDGGTLTQLTSGGGNTSPALSPDGMQVIYAVSKDKRSTLWRVSVDGGQPTQISHNEASWPVVSPDGKFVACVYGNAADASTKKIAILPIIGGEPVKTFNLAKNGIGFNRLRWPSGGDAIIYKDLVQGLWRQDLKKDKPDMVHGFDNTRVYHFAHSSDGRLVYSGGIPAREIVILSNYR